MQKNDSPRQRRGILFSREILLRPRTKSPRYSLENKLKVGVIGAGVMGYAHARIYSQLPNVGLVGIYDIELNRAAKVKEELGVKLFANLEELKKICDAFSICTPTSTHFEIGSELLSSHKHLLIEKPITDKISQGEKLLSIAQKNSLKLTVGHIERFNPIIEVIKKKIKDKKIISINITRVGPIPPRVKDVGIILDLGVHDIDLIRYLTNSDFERSFVVKSAEKASREDAATLGFKMKNGVIASIVTNWYTPFKVRKIEIALQESLIVGDFIAQEVSEFLGSPGLDFSTHKLIVKKEEPLKRELMSFVNSVLSNKPVEVDPQDALESVKVALKLTSLN